MVDQAIAVRLDVAVQGRELTASLRFENKSPRTYLLYRFNVPDEGRITKTIFDIRANGERVRYIGRKVKRGAPTAKDFIELEAGGQIEVSLRLDQFYRFPPGRVHCLVRYSALNPYRDRVGFTEILSNEVEFDLH